jgi:hypothetical protein
MKILNILFTGFCMIGFFIALSSGYHKEGMAVMLFNGFMMLDSSINMK